MNNCFNIFHFILTLVAGMSFLMLQYLIGIVSEYWTLLFSFLMRKKKLILSYVFNNFWTMPMCSILSPLYKSSLFSYFSPYLDQVPFSLFRFGFVFSCLFANRSSILLCETKSDQYVVNSRFSTKRSYMLQKHVSQYY